MSDLLAHLFRQLTLHLNFIYIGKVNVLEDDLYAFLSVAGDLKIGRAHIKLVPPSEPSQVFRPHKRSRYLVHSLPPLLSRLTCEGSP